MSDSSPSRGAPTQSVSSLVISGKDKVALVEQATNGNGHPAARVRAAEAIVLKFIDVDEETTAPDLLCRVAPDVADESIASLAIWQLIDSGTLCFTPGRRLRRG